jgi:signal transduction histidine kinase
LVDSLAKLFRITADLIEYIPCNIETLAQDVFRGLQQLEKEDPATITFSSLPVLEADVLQYRLLFKNLFENSIRFRKKGIPVKIQISSELLNDKEKRFWSLQENKNYYKIDISDNGIGFKQENAEKIFHPFVRLHGKSQFPGNGIGLAICRKIMDIHEGIIYAEGRENEGARFILILPESH